MKDNSIRMGPLYLSSLVYLPFAALCVLILVPSLFRNLDALCLSSQGHPMTVGYYLMMGGLFLILLSVTAILLATSFPNRTARHAYEALFFCVLALSTAYTLSDWDNRARAFTPSERFVMVETNTLGLGLDEALNSLQGCNLVDREFKRTKYESVANERRIYPGNLYELVADVTERPDGIAVSAYLAKGQPAATGIRWQIIDSTEITGERHYCCAYEKLSRRMSAAIGVSIDSSLTPLSADGCEGSARAYQSYLAGMEQYRKGRPENLDSAIALFTSALSIEAGFHAARSRLADCYSHLYYRLWRPTQSVVDSAIELLSVVVGETDGQSACLARSRGLYNQVLAFRHQWSYRFLTSSSDDSTSAVAIYLDSSMLEIEEALESYSLAETQGCRDGDNNNNRLVALMQKGSIAHALGQTQVAMSCLLEARNGLLAEIRSNPFVPSLYVNTGLSYLWEWSFTDETDSSLLRSAESYLIDGLKYAVDDAAEGEMGALYYNLVCVYSEMGDIGAAKMYFPLAVQKSTFNVRTKITGDPTIVLSADEDLRNFWNSPAIELNWVNDILVGAGYEPLETKPFIEQQA